MVAQWNDSHRRCRRATGGGQGLVTVAILRVVETPFKRLLKVVLRLHSRACAAVGRPLAATDRQQLRNHAWVGIHRHHLASDMYHTVSQSALFGWGESTKHIEWETQDIDVKKRRGRGGGNNVPELPH